MSRPKAVRILLGGLIAGAFLLLLGPWLHAPDGASLKPPAIRLPEPGRLGPALPAGPSLGSSQERALASAPGGTPEKPQMLNPGQRPPKAFTPPPEVVRKLKKEGSVIY